MSENGKMTTAETIPGMGGEAIKEMMEEVNSKL
jgi:tRNA A22 N-methylase